jgi:Cd2+/Zn2+-exporting ATPase
MSRTSSGSVAGSPSELAVIEMPVRGMDCGSCAATIESAVKRVDGVDRCDVDFAGEVLRYEGAAAPEAVRKAVEAAGFEAPVPGAAAQDGAAPPEAAATGGILGFLRWAVGRRDVRPVLIALPLALPGLIFGEILGIEAAWVSVSSIAAAAIAGGPVLLAAWRALVVSRRITIHVLMTVATIGAIGIGAFAEAGMLMVLFGVGEALEGWSAGRAREAIRSLSALAPETAERLRRADGTPIAGGRETVAADALSVGDVVLVRPGDRVPSDGEVVVGVSAIDQAAVTGESMPVPKEPGAPVFGATVNGAGALEVRITHAFHESVVARIARMVTEARSKRAPIERLVDRFAAVYTPAVVVIAAAVAFLPPLVLGQPLLGEIDGRPGWLYRGLALLVVACPCALVIGTPVAVVSAIGAAARRGVLVKGGEALERLARVKAVTFDKTGTLTIGEPEVVGLVAVDCNLGFEGVACAVPSLRGANGAGSLSNGARIVGGTAAEAVGRCVACDDLLSLADAVERRSEHPLARAVVSAVEARGGSRLPDAEAVEAMPGRGVRGKVNGHEVVVASHRHFDETMPHDAALCAAIDADAALGLTPMLVGADGTYLGRINLSDAVRDSAPEAVAELRARLGAEAVVMLTGDGPAAARLVGAAVGVADGQVLDSLMPADKTEAVHELRARHGAVMMIGDGINDTPALAAADIGVAMGGPRGTAQALETADVALMSGDLRRVPWAMRLARAARLRVREIIGITIAIKVGYAALTIVGLGTMWGAVLADVGASVLATAMGLRLLHWGRE